MNDKQTDEKLVKDESVKPVDDSKAEETVSVPPEKKVTGKGKSRAKSLESTDPPVIETSVEEVSVDPLVVIKSADSRQLEASIGSMVWKGREIEVPQSQAGDVRRMLEGAGYFLKD